MVSSSVNVHVRSSCFESSYSQFVLLVSSPVKETIVTELNDSRGTRSVTISVFVFIPVAFTVYSDWDFTG